MAQENKNKGKEYSPQHETRLHRLLLDKYNYDPIYSQYIPQEFIDFKFFLKARFDEHNKVKEITSE